MGARHQPSQKRQVSAATVVVSTQRKACMKATLCTRTSPDDSQSFKKPPVVGVLPSRALVSSSVRPHVQLYCADTVPRTCFTSPPKPASSCNPRHAHTHVTTRCRATHSEAPGPSSRRCPPRSRTPVPTMLPPEMGAPCLRTHQTHSYTNSKEHTVSIHSCTYM